MPRDPRALLADVLDAARSIERFGQGLDLDGFRADELTRAAVERKLEIAGEALNRLSRADPELAARIPDIARIVGFRNVLAHGYEVVDNEVVWNARSRPICHGWSRGYRRCWRSWMLRGSPAEDSNRRGSSPSPGA